MKKQAQVGILAVMCCVTLFLVWKSGFRYQEDQDDFTYEADDDEAEDHMTRQDSESCDPLRNFVFVKTHKTGSSTMSNILLRLSENHKLNQLMGRYPTGTEYNDLTSHMYNPPPEGQTYNSFLMHANYNYNFLRSKLPKSTKFFTVIRDPVSRYISAFKFFGHAKYFDKGNFESAVLKHIQANSNYLVKTAACKKCSRAVNSVAVDMGFDVKQYVKSADKQTYLSEFINLKDKELDLVMISEYYDLSLVLMARRYCWTFDDICYLKSLESSSKPFVSQETKKKIREFQHVDAKIYDHYNKTFWELVNKEEGIFEDLEKFKEHNINTHNKCVAKKEVGNFQHTFDYKLTEFGLTDFQCLAMSSRVLPFSHLIEKRNQGMRNDGPHPDGLLKLQDLYDIRYGKESDSD